MSHKNMEFMADIWQEGAITTLTPLDKKRWNDFPCYNLQPSKNMKTA